MSLSDKIQSAYYAVTGKAQALELPDNKIQEVDAKKRSKASIPKERQIFRTLQDIKKLEDAITSADSTTKNRQYLHEIYRQCVLEDTHVTSQWKNRKVKTLKKSGGVYIGDSEEKDEELTAIFEKPWFYDFIDKVLDTEAWGFSCLEMLVWDRDLLEFKPYRTTDGRMMDAVQVINQDYVKPEFGVIATELFETKGVDIFKFPNQLIYTGGKGHGFMYKLAKPCLFKQNATANWSEWIEVFGLDTILFFSDAEGTDRKQLLDSVKQLGTSRMGVFDIDDKAEAFGSSKTDAYKVFEQMNRYIDESISKCIHGQDVVSNNTGQVVGEVGENVANDYSAVDAKMVSYVINSMLFPLMTRNGFLDLSNAKWKYDEALSMREMNERADLDLKITQMGFKHNPDQLNERYGVDVESIGTATTEEVKNKLKNLYPNARV